jgi:hypothetical protein
MKPSTANILYKPNTCTISFIFITYITVLWTITVNTKELLIAYMHSVFILFEWSVTFQLQYDQQNNISVFTVTVCLFSRKESLWDIAVRINTEQQDIKPPSGSQPKERTILILGSKGVVSIAFLAPRSAPLLQMHNKYNEKVQ